jgi:putative hydrolase of the HAD superfamily
MLRAITFDFWGTLYQNLWAREARLTLLQEALVQADQARSWEELDGAYRHGWEFFGQVWTQEHRSISFEEWLGAMLAFLGADLPAEAWSRLRGPMQEVYLHGDAPEPVPGVSELLPRLAQRYRLGLISDVGLTPGRVLGEIMRRHGLRTHFTTLTFSDEIGATKPLPLPFMHTLKILDVRPEEAVHIGDLPETDLKGAKGVGMRAILFLGVSQREDGRPLADAVISDYAELEKILEGMGG